jgi:DNA-binding MurR/RpiR family transcriptional regulator
MRDHGNGGCIELAVTSEWAREASGGLEDRLSAAFSELSQKQAGLARYLLDNKWEVAFSSAAMVGSRAGVNAATVVRFAQALGYQGFTELQEEIRAGLPRFVTTAEKIREELATPTSPENIRSRAFAAQIRNIERGAQLTTAESFDRAVDRIVAARMILVSGAGLGEPVAGYLRQALRTIGADARDASRGAMHLALELAGCGREDLFIAIGFLRYVRDTVEGLSQAVEIGVQTLTITDDRLSPLARRADLALIVAAEGIQSTSVVGAIALAEALSAAVALRQPERTMRALEQAEALYHRAGLLLD